MGYDRAYLDGREESRRQEDLAQQRLADLSARVAAHDPANQGRVLGGNKANGSQFDFEDTEFEDDTGEQRRANETIAADLDYASGKLAQVRIMAEAQSEEIDRQNAQINRIQEQVRVSKWLPSIPGELANIVRFPG